MDISKEIKMTSPLNCKMVQVIHRCPRIDFLFNFVIVHEEIVCKIEIAFENLTEFVLIRINITVKFGRRIICRIISLINKKIAVKLVLNNLIFILKELRKCNRQKRY